MAEINGGKEKTDTILIGFNWFGSRFRHDFHSREKNPVCFVPNSCTDEKWQVIRIVCTCERSHVPEMPIISLSPHLWWIAAYAITIRGTRSPKKKSPCLRTTANRKTRRLINRQLAGRESRRRRVFTRRDAPGKNHADPNPSKQQNT